MNKFHISKDGVARPCGAKVSCPIGGESIHFDNYEDAVKSSESKNAEKYGNVPSVRRNKEEFAPRAVDNAASEKTLNEKKSEFFKSYVETSSLIDEISAKENRDEVEDEMLYQLQDIAGESEEGMMNADGVNAYLFDKENLGSELESRAAESVFKLLKNK